MIERDLNARECVPIWANSMRMPQKQAIYLYARKLAKIDRTIDIMIENLRFTRLVTGNSNQRLSLVNIMKQVDEGKPLVYTTPGFDPSSVQVLDLGVHPETLPRLMDARNSLWNQAMGFLGINNANQDKAERLVASEVSANDEQVLAVRATALNARQYAAEQISTMFKLDVSVSYDQSGSLPTMPDGQGQFDLDNENEGSTDNGNVHSDASGSN
jgi:Phage Connector (GP10).